ncbi:hypothetical protein A3L11_08500 [Thermococcus siculi]|uniref:CRISPR type III-associated protein domain-containing protein n=1 Tax=Thermococcus siculi TaxID=72803 RepID=A0A2Z2MNQ0_9EURY|nr:type III-B CRISPR module RAMP protein Cmr1 [Thermococcus siculi]ASJ09265.1 hypothetical protein A3L11_08500 [Thermococcus siculi]
MYEATFELEAITPLFMRGADQRKAEFRPASVKGVMRWWFRALAGRHLGGTPKAMTALRSAESLIFGSAGKTGTRRSRVIVDVDILEESNKSFPLDDYSRYFWFSQVGRYTKSYIPPGTTFEITLRSHEEAYLKIAMLSLWAAVHLGGFGSRARKFGGSLSFTREPDSDVSLGLKFVPGQGEDGIKMFYRKNDNDKQERGISYVASTVKNLLSKMGFKGGAPSNPPKFPILHERYSFVFLGDVHEDPTSAIEEVGKWYLGTPDENGRFDGGFRFQSQRADRRIPHRIYDQFSQGKKSIKSLAAYSERRPYLGFPIQFYKSFSEDEFVQFTVDHWNADKKTSKKTNRRASGLWFSLNRVGRHYYPIVTGFFYEFFPDYHGPVRYRGGVYKKIGKRKEQLASAGGALFILKKNEEPLLAYTSFYRDLYDSLFENFEAIYGEGVGQ